MNWNYYIDLPVWTLHQGLCLLNGIEPNNFVEQWQFRNNKFILRDESKRLLDSDLSYDEKIQTIEKLDGIKRKYLKEMGTDIPSEQLVNRTDAHGSIEFDGHKILVKPFEFITWAKEKGFDIHNELNSFDTSNKNSLEKISKRKKEYKSKSQKQQEVILSIIKNQGLDPMSIPHGWKKKMEEECKKNFPHLFFKTSFETAWKKGLRETELWRTENHDDYSKRGGQ